MMKRGESRRWKLLLVLVAGGMLGLMLPAKASAPCTWAAGEVIDTFTEGIAPAPIDCRSSGPVASAAGGREGKSGDQQCPGFCSKCGCNGGAP